MQALDTTVFLCYAPADRETAGRIANFLERGADVRVFRQEGEIREGEDLVGKAREARMADIAVVLFSRHSLPPRWRRAQWEGALVSEPETEGMRIGFVRCDDCVPPRVLRPLFELGERASIGLRELKRWVRGRSATFQPPSCEPGADLEWLAVAIADRPGSETVDLADTAFAFADAFREDFDEIFRLECTGRSLAALAGDLGSQLGLRIQGDLEDNLERLREFCEQRRFLLILDGAQNPAAGELMFEGRCSTLLSLGAGPPVPDELRETQRALAAPGRHAWSELCRLARLGRRMTAEQGRLAECHELMQQWHALAEARGDREAMNESAREMIWILESWGRQEEAWRLDYRRAMEMDEQMRLF